ncbi:MAG TPA: trypsin-like serine protease [Kofleriaceae bacterium]|nr:trypsin-like serine protease [Kofleriaceae bacterium]
MRATGVVLGCVGGVLGVGGLVGLGGLGLGACTEPYPDVGARADEVIGGQVTPDGMYPGVGGLLYDLGEGPQLGCTGTLISPTVVLTAAHCVDPQLGGDELVGFTFAHDTVTAPPPMITVDHKVRHEQFDLQADIPPGLGHWYDIGLVFLAQPVTDVAPVKLPRPTDKPSLVADADLTIVGYGRTSNETGDVGVMHDAATKLVSLGDFELQVAGGNGQPQNCNGDSGGPALVELDGTRTVGIVSRSFDGMPNCLNGGVDTRVDAYLDWITAQGVTDLPCGSGNAAACKDDDDGDDGGCCSTSRHAPGGSILLAGLVAGGLVRRRRRR